MQDEVNQKVVTLCINGGKISARILKDALAKLLKKMEQMERQKLQELKRGGFLPWETEYGKADEAELSAYKYRSDRWKYQVF